MSLTLEQITKRLNEIPMLIQELLKEQNQIIGYKVALEDIEKAKSEEKEKGKSKETN